MVIAGHSSDNYIDMCADTRAEGVQLAYKVVCVVPHAFFDAWHLEVVCTKALITQVLAKSVGESTFAAAWDAGDQND